MKKQLLTLLFLLAFLAITQAQRVMSIPEARKAGMTLEGMDSLYMSAFNLQDTTLEAFPGQTETFMAQWDSTLNMLKTYIAAHGMRFELGQMMTYRSFFNQAGSMEHFHHLFKPAIDEEKAREFDTLVDAFFKSFVFPMVPSQPFRQCGTTALEPRGHKE